MQNLRIFVLIFLRLTINFEILYSFTKDFSYVDLEKLVIVTPRETFFSEYLLIPILISICRIKAKIEIIEMNKHEINSRIP